MKDAKAEVIKLTAVHKWFGQEEVLKGINLDVSDGERLVICGRSGSGKSTLVRCINGLIRPDTGEVVVAGHSLGASRRDDEAIRRQVGVVFQQFHLFPHLRVIENLSLPLTLVQRKNRSEATDFAMTYLQRLSIDSLAERYPHEISGGQQQRVAIARALCMQPRILICDEPTSALDPEMTASVLGLLLELSAQGLTLVCVTHDERFAENLAERVVYMDAGRVVGEPRPAAAGRTSLVAQRT